MMNIKLLETQRDCIHVYIKYFLTFSQTYGGSVHIIAGTQAIITCNYIQNLNTIVIVLFTE